MTPAEKLGIPGLLLGFVEPVNKLLLMITDWECQGIKRAEEILAEEKKARAKETEAKKSRWRKFLDSFRRKTDSQGRLPTRDQDSQRESVCSVCGHRQTTDSRR